MTNLPIHIFGTRHYSKLKISVNHKRKLILSTVQAGCSHGSKILNSVLHVIEYKLIMIQKAKKNQPSFAESRLSSLLMQFYITELTFRVQGRKYNWRPDLSLQGSTIPSGRKREQGPYVQKRAGCPRKAA